MERVNRIWPRIPWARFRRLGRRRYRHTEALQMRWAHLVIAARTMRVDVPQTVFDVVQIKWDDPRSLRRDLVRFGRAPMLTTYKAAEGLFIGSEQAYRSQAAYVQSLHEQARRLGVPLSEQCSSGWCNCASCDRERARLEWAD